MSTQSHNDAVPTVLGGGLTGLLLALLLARRGLRVQVFDRGPDPRYNRAGGGRSINLALAERGRRALQRAGLLADVMPLTIPMTGRQLHPHAGPEQYQPYGQFSGEQIYSVGRHDLTVILANACEARGVELHFGRRCVEIADDLRSVVVEADGGTETVSCAPLLAADGAGSMVRRQLDRNGMLGATETLLDHGYKELAIPATGYGWYRTNPNALHIWPRGGHMLIALPNLGGDFTVTLFLPQDGEPGFGTLVSAAAVEAFFANHYAAAAGLMPQLARDFAANPVGIMGTVRTQRWNIGGDVLLLGDAAHAIVPFHGQGMNAAFEDCRVLDELMDTTGTDWAALFDQFSGARIDNANAIADMALENYVEMRDSVRDDLFHVRKALAFELERREPGHFVPRYSMVMFHPEIPYAEAQRRGRVQAELLAEFTRDKTNLDAVDIAAAAAAVRERLSAL